MDKKEKRVQKGLGTLIEYQYTGIRTIKLEFEIDVMLKPITAADEKEAKEYLAKLETPELLDKTLKNIQHMASDFNYDNQRYPLPRGFLASLTKSTTEDKHLIFITSKEEIQDPA